MSTNNSWRRYVPSPDLVLGCFSLGILAYYALHRYLENQPSKDVTRRLEGVLAERAREREEEARTRRGEKGAPPTDDRSLLNLSTYEQQIASEIVLPEEIPVSFADIGGLDDVISDLQTSVIYPLTMPQLYAQSSRLLTAPTGVLLYGPPGCGKTMLAKALAHESGACFINLHISTLTEKWYGDSNKLVSAVFSLARKLAPAIVFIDEIDAIMGNRRSGEHEASGMIKAEMMTHLDGLTSSNKGTRDPQRILVLGATNRIQDIDEAILRRMPKRFAVGLPGVEQRKRIFKLVLRETKIDKTPDENGNKRHFDLDYLVRVSHGMSGSDIKEACREAAMIPLREVIQRHRASGQSFKSAPPEELRGLRTEDFFQKYTSNARDSRDAKDDVDSGDEGFVTTDESGSEDR